MISNPTVFSGVVKNGVVVPEGKATLPEGVRVEIHVPPPEIPPELQAEFKAWEKASDEAWAMINQWEREEQP
jgi:hypothetical protein